MSLDLIMSNIIVSLKQTSKQYKNLSALNNINLELKAGEVLGLFGHNGAGKTTMMKTILGVIEPSRGEVSVFGYKPTSKQGWFSRKHIGYLPENVSFYDHLSGFDILSYFARLKSASKKQVIELLDLVGLSHAANRQVKTYSKGMRQRLGLAQAFLGQPKLLLLDEPTVGLDPIATKEFYQSVDALKQQGASIILCSHVLPGVEQHIDRAMILAKGEALALGSIDELREQAQLPITIETHGLQEDLSADAYLSPYVVTPNRLQVKQSNKLAVLKYVLDKDGMLDIHVEQANLEQLYQFYLGGEVISSQPIGAEI